MNTLENQFTDRLMEAVKTMRDKHGYNPSIFLQMMDKSGPVEACNQLINAKNISEGFTKLWELKQLDLTVEAISLEPKWNPLFSPALREIARKRLRKYGFVPTNEEPDLVEEDSKVDATPWSRTELEATVHAYLSMLNKEQIGESYNKAEVNRLLREGGPLKLRTKGSIEFRMQNISSVMDGLCLPRINGYLPAKNIGKRVFEEIAGILAGLQVFRKEEYEPTDDPEEFDKRSAELQEKIGAGTPIGNDAPVRVEQKAFGFKRDPLVKAWILKNANGKCEKCDANAPFKKETGEPFLEVHHLIRLCEEGRDTIDNAVGLCPNCHRELHYSREKAELIKKLKAKIGRLK
ncbi:MAG: HNH endonuclease [Chloroflexota bacterium]|nr:HNH endonuclease [Chloroflexota bacterium]